MRNARELYRKHVFADYIFHAAETNKLNLTKRTVTTLMQGAGRFRPSTQPLFIYVIYLKDALGPIMHQAPI